jgi:hypothetical protein
MTPAHHAYKACADGEDVLHRAARDAPNKAFCDAMKLPNHYGIWGSFTVGSSAASSEMDSSVCFTAKRRTDTALTVHTRKGKR